MRLSIKVLVALMVLSSSFAHAQFPEASKEHEILKKDVGTWEATIKLWMGEDGQADASASPIESKGVEVNRMLGEFWCIGSYKGEFGGQPFEGHAVNGYDPKMKKFVGSWVDSVTPHASHMVGTYDAETKTLTSTSVTIGMDGNEVKGKAVLVYHNDDHRTLSMYETKDDGKEVKSMEISYVRKK